MLSLTLNSDYQEVDNIRQQARVYCTENGLSETKIGHVELILSEAINNVIEHAYKETAGHLIRFNLDIHDHTITMQVFDQGHPAPSTLYQDAQFPEEESLPDGGWGTGIVTLLANTVDYQAADDANVLTISLSLD